MRHVLTRTLRETFFKKVLRGLVYSTCVFSEQIYCLNCTEYVATHRVVRRTPGYRHGAVSNSEALYLKHQPCQTQCITLWHE